MDEQWEDLQQADVIRDSILSLADFMNNIQLELNYKSVVSTDLNRVISINLNLPEDELTKKETNTWKHLFCHILDTNDETASSLWEKYVTPQIEAHPDFLEVVSPCKFVVETNTLFENGFMIWIRGRQALGKSKWILCGVHIAYMKQDIFILTVKSKHVHDFVHKLRIDDEYKILYL